MGRARWACLAALGAVVAACDPSVDPAEDERVAQARAGLTLSNEVVTALSGPMAYVVAASSAHVGVGTANSLSRFDLSGALVGTTSMPGLGAVSVGDRLFVGGGSSVTTSTLAVFGPSGALFNEVMSCSSGPAEYARVGTDGVHLFVSSRCRNFMGVDPFDDVFAPRMDVRDLGGALINSTVGPYTSLPPPVASACSATSALCVDGDDPRRAHDGVDYVVVSVAGGAVVAMHLDASGVALGAPTTVSHSTGTASSPVITWDGASYFVAWADTRNGQDDVYANWLGPDGAPQEASDTSISANVAAEQPFGAARAGASGRVVVGYRRGTVVLRFVSRNPLADGEVCASDTECQSGCCSAGACAVGACATTVASSSNATASSNVASSSSDASSSAASTSSDASSSAASTSSDASSSAASTSSDASSSSSSSSGSSSSSSASSSASSSGGSGGAGGSHGNGEATASGGGCSTSASDPDAPTFVAVFALGLAHALRRRARRGVRR